MIRKELANRARLEAARQQTATVQDKLKALRYDQDQLRQDLNRVPWASESYKRYLQKFDAQEQEMEALKVRAAQQQEKEKALLKEIGDAQDAITVE